MKVEYVNPVMIKITEYNDSEIDILRKKLTYNSTQALFALKKFKHNKWLAQTMDPEEHAERLAKLKADVKKVLLFERKGEFFFYSGLLDRVKKTLARVEVKPTSPAPPLPTFPRSWANKPHTPRYYQAAAVAAVTGDITHGAISMATGTGKSLVIAMIARLRDTKTVIMVPSSSIARQLYEDLTYLIGEPNVGLYGDGKKQFKKQIVIAIDKSLANVKKGTDIWKELSSAKLVMVDESHMVAVETQEVVMAGLLRNAPFRHFFSATQFRNDGSDLLLEGITGPIVYEYPIEKGLSDGFLAKPKFFLGKCETPRKANVSDALKILDKSFYKNKNLHKKAALLANKMVSDDHPVMIMIDHIEQFSLLLPHLERQPAFAYGSLTPEQKKKIPEKFWNKDTGDIVKDFNAGKIKLLIGTKAIGMGTDTRPVKSIINLQGGQSGVKFLQLIGRGTRKVDGKDFFNFFDFDVPNEDILHRWFETRVDLYKSITDEVYYI